MKSIIKRLENKYRLGSYIAVLEKKGELLILQFVPGFRREMYYEGTMAALRYKLARIVVPVPASGIEKIIELNGYEWVKYLYRRKLIKNNIPETVEKMIRSRELTDGLIKKIYIRNAWSKIAENMNKILLLKDNGNYTDVVYTLRFLAFNCYILVLFMEDIDEGALPPKWSVISLKDIPARVLGKREIAWLRRLINLGRISNNKVKKKLDQFEYMLGQCASFTACCPVIRGNIGWK